MTACRTCGKELIEVMSKGYICINKDCERAKMDILYDQQLAEYQSQYQWGVKIK